MPHIVTLRSKGQEQDVISLVLSQDAVCTEPDGNPWSGVTLNAEQARCVGIFGIDTRGSEITASTDHCEWQKGWLSRLVDIYSRQAEESGFTFRHRFLPGYDPCVVLDLLYRAEFDLLVI